MSRDDYFRLVFKILTELYAALRMGERVDITCISAEALKIPNGYWTDIMANLLEDGYTKGDMIRDYITGSKIEGIEGIKIAPKGIEYLKENTMMQKVFKYLKEIGEIVPSL